MMSEPKPFASLSSGLLARKGQARPAMRPQGFTGGYPSLATNLEDLGWNDMGHAPEPFAPGPFAPEPFADIHPIDEATAIVPPPDGVPPVLAQRRQLHEELAAPEIEADEPDGAVHAEPAAVVPITRRPVSVATATRLAKATRHKDKAAFTLRLDQDRHLRLRLASAVSGRSAQHLVTEALDAFLVSLPEVDDLARQVPARAAR